MFYKSFLLLEIGIFFFTHACLTYQKKCLYLGLEKNKRYKTMKTFKWFIFAAFIIVLFSCSKNHISNLDDPTFDGQTRCETTQEDSTNTDRIGGDINDWDECDSENITANEVLL